MPTDNATSWCQAHRKERRGATDISEVGQTLVLSKVTQNESDTRRRPRAPRLQTDESAVKVLHRRPGGRETKREAVEVGGTGMGGGERHTHRRMD